MSSYKRMTTGDVRATGATAKNLADATGRRFAAAICNSSAEAGEAASLYDRAGFKVEGLRYRTVRIDGFSVGVWALLLSEPPL